MHHSRLVAASHQFPGEMFEFFGRERVLAGSDCGFGTYAGRKGVFPSVVRAKFRALAQGAHMATDRLWG